MALEEGKHWGRRGRFPGEILKEQGLLGSACRYPVACDGETLEVLYMAIPTPRLSGSIAPEVQR